MSSEPSPFLPEPEPAAPPAAPKGSGAKTLALWVVLILMFLGVWTFLAPHPAQRHVPVGPPCEPSAWWVTASPMVGSFALLILFGWWFKRRYGQSLEFNLAQEPGRSAMAERRFGAAFEAFARVQAAYAKQPAYHAAASLSLGVAQLAAGQLDHAIDTFATLEKKRTVLFSSGIRTLAAVNLALAQALAGQLDAAERWCAEASARLAKNGDNRLDYASRLHLAESVLALRRERPAEAVALLEKNWTGMREFSNGNSMRVAEVLRAFGESAGGMRESNTMTERLLRVEPVLPGDFAFLGVKWPEMQLFLDAHGLGARAA